MLVIRAVLLVIEVAVYPVYWKENDFCSGWNAGWSDTVPSGFAFFREKHWTGRCKTGGGTRMVPRVISDLGIW